MRRRDLLKGLLLLPFNPLKKSDTEEFRQLPVKAISSKSLPFRVKAIKTFELTRTFHLEPIPTKRGELQILSDSQNIEVTYDIELTFKDGSRLMCCDVPSNMVNFNGHHELLNCLSKPSCVVKDLCWCVFDNAMLQMYYCNQVVLEVRLYDTE